MPRVDTRAVSRLRPLFWLGRFGLCAVGVVAGFMGPYLYWLDRLVIDELARREFAFPTKVYARALTLYEGKALSKAQLRVELEAAGYRESATLHAGGRFRIEPDGLALRTRPFVHADGADPGRAARVRLVGNRVSRVEQLDSGVELPLLRVDPALIGSIYPTRAEDREWVRLAQIPSLIVTTLIAVEDQGFKTHVGVDPMALLRAAISNTRSGRLRQGGSTLTQQLVKNWFLSRDRDFGRKFVELNLALVVEHRMTKAQILEAYLNDVYLGQDGARAIHGMAAAARYYFDMPLADLRGEQIALLVGMIRGPSLYDPRRDAPRAQARRDAVIDRMQQAGLIDGAGAREFKSRALAVVDKPERSGLRHPAYFELVRRQLRAWYDDHALMADGLVVLTTLEPAVQRAAEAALNDGLTQIEKDRELTALNGAVVVSDIASGAVLALVGDRDASRSGFNRALAATRPIGSLIKPLVYLLAFADPQRYNLATVVDDAPLRMRQPNGQLWQPNNYDGQSHGPVSTLVALSRSYNLATIRVGLDVGVDRVARLIAAMGVARAVQPHPSLLLGAVDLTPFEVAHLYQTLANKGTPMPLYAVEAVLDRNGQALRQERPRLVGNQWPAANYLLTLALQEAVQSGTGGRMPKELRESLTPAGKTGTSNDLRDAWFAGYTGAHLAVVWVGRDDNAPAGLTGATGALEVWARLFNRIGTDPLKPQPPANIVFAWLDARSGRRSAEYCADAILLPFIRGHEPTGPQRCEEVDAWFGRR